MDTFEPVEVKLYTGVTFLSFADDSADTILASVKNSEYLESTIREARAKMPEGHEVLEVSVGITSRKLEDFEREMFAEDADDPKGHV